MSRITFDDLLSGDCKSSSNFEINPDQNNGKLKIIKKSARKPCGCLPTQVCWSCTDITESERSIENDIFGYCDNQPNCLVVKTDTKGNRKKGRWIKSNPKERKGKQDLIICYYGFFIAVEVKREKETQSKDQINYQKDVESAQGEYWVVHSLDSFKLKFEWFKTIIDNAYRSGKMPNF